MDLLKQCVANVFKRVWEDYRNQVTDVSRIEAAIRTRGETWHEDHVAFRTLPGLHCGAHVLQGIFEALGYTRRDAYHFTDKQIEAFWMEPPGAKELACAMVSPKIFVSELVVKGFSPAFQACVQSAAASVKASPLARIQELASEVAHGSAFAASTLEDTVVAVLTRGPAWPRPMRSDYLALLKESEYAAWTLVFGNRANHFTVSVYLMEHFASLQAFNEHITGTLKIPMNAAGGGIIKGTPELRLEQSATVAAKVPVLFQDGILELAFAFIEFAFRYPQEGRLADGRWSSYYQGFVVNNADKIFESTHMNH